MNSSNQTLELGQPAPPRKKGKVLTLLVILFVLFLLLIALVAGSVLGWFSREVIDMIEEPPPGWTEVAHGIGMLPPNDDGNIIFTVDSEIADAWACDPEFKLLAADIPETSEQVAAAAAELEQAIRDRDDRGAVYLVFAMLSTPPSLRRSADFHLMEAVKQDRTGLVVGMTHAGLRSEAVDSYGNNALHVAARHDRHKIAEALLEAEVFEIDSINSVGRTPLAVAAESGSRRTIEVIVAYARENGTLVQLLGAKDNDGQTPAQLAKEHGYDLLLPMLDSE